MKFITEYPNWYEFTKRLPRVTPRYRRDPKQQAQLQAMQQAELQRLYSLQQAQCTSGQLMAIYAQQQQQMYPPMSGAAFGFGLWPWQ